jgi:glycerophosphoryl diester phosphodiesterase
MGLVVVIFCGGCTSASAPAVPQAPTVQAWLKTTPLQIAHRGGDRDWPEGTAEAYRNAAAWNPSLALEVPAWRTLDGVWVVSEDRTTGRVFDADYAIPSTQWSTLARLHTRDGGQPMARLVQDVLDPYGKKRVLFVDNKADTAVSSFMDLLDAHGGHSQIVVKSFSRAAQTASEAHRRGYVTWGYYFLPDLPVFASTQSNFDMLGLPYDAPSSDFQMMLATGKPVIAHIVSTQAAARQGLDHGARGLMISDVEAVVPRAHGGD